MPVASSTDIREFLSVYVMMNIDGRAECHRNVKCKHATNRLLNLCLLTDSEVDHLVLFHTRQS